MKVAKENKKLISADKENLSELRWYHVKCVLRIRTFYF